MEGKPPPNLGFESRALACCAAQFATPLERAVGNLASGAPTQFHHELNHGEMGKGDPLWGLKPGMLARPIHGGSGGHFMVIWAQFMVIWIHGGF